MSLCLVYSNDGQSNALPYFDLTRVSSFTSKIATINVDIYKKQSEPEVDLLASNLAFESVSEKDGISWKQVRDLSKDWILKGWILASHSPLLSSFILLSSASPLCLLSYPSPSPLPLPSLSSPVCFSLLLPPSSHLLLVHFFLRANT